MKYRKKPVVVDAVQWTGENQREMFDFLTDHKLMNDYMTASGKNFYVDHFKVPGGLIIRTLEGEHIANISDYIIRGVNGEFYPCKAEIFEKTYEKVEVKTMEQTTFTFSDAIKYLKRGKKVARKGWNGKKQYIQLASAISYKTADGIMVNCEHADIGNHAIAFVGTSGVQMGWLASQADMLAEDWVLAGDGSIVVDTELDSDGFRRDSDKLLSAVGDLTDAVDKLGESMLYYFSEKPQK